MWLQAAFIACLPRHAVFPMGGTLRRLTCKPKQRFHTVVVGLIVRWIGTRHHHQPSLMIGVGQHNLRNGGRYDLFAEMLFKETAEIIAIAGSEFVDLS